MCQAVNINRATIAQAYERTRAHLRRTPVLEVPGAEFGLGDCTLVLKLEQLQHTGSFKARGAFANLILRDTPAAGVVAASGGNHGVAVAHAATCLGIPATIFVPTISSPAKVQRIRDCGAELVIIGDRYADALAASEEWAARSGALPVHAYDQPETLLGAGSVALEIEEQTAPLDALLVAVGGGGLSGAIAAWYAGAMRIVPVEPEEAPTLTMALRAGHPIDAPAGGIAADSLAPRRVGALMFPYAQQFMEPVTLVDDDSIRRAQEVLWSELRIVARARRRRGVRGAALPPLSAAARRARWRRHLRRECHEVNMSVHEKLEAMQITLPAPAASVAVFVPFVRSGNLLFISGHIARRDGEPWTGKLGADMTTADGKLAARTVAIDLLGTLRAAAGSLDSIRRIVKLMVLVNSDPSFTEQHLVANGASELFLELFGDAGAHARSAFGVAQAPFGSCVEIELIAEV